MRIVLIAILWLASLLITVSLFSLNRTMVNALREKDKQIEKLEANLKRSTAQTDKCLDDYEKFIKDIHDSNDRISQSLGIKH